MHLGKKLIIARRKGGFNHQLINTDNVNTVVIEVFILPKCVGAISNEAYFDVSKNLSHSIGCGNAKYRCNNDPTFKRISLANTFEAILVGILFLNDNEMTVVPSNNLSNNVDNNGTIDGSSYIVFINLSITADNVNVIVAFFGFPVIILYVVVGINNDFNNITLFPLLCFNKNSTNPIRLDIIDVDCLFISINFIIVILFNRE